MLTAKERKEVYELLSVGYSPDEIIDIFESDDEEAEVIYELYNEFVNSLEN